MTVTGVGGVPADAKAVVLNLTVTDTTSSSYLTVWPAGQPQPTASNLNWPAGDTRPNLVVAKVGAGGTVSIFNLLGSTDVIADVQGWFDDGSDVSADALVAVSPTRMLDSRDGTGGYSQPWGAHTQHDLSIAGACGRARRRRRGAPQRDRHRHDCPLVPHGVAGGADRSRPPPTSTGPPATPAPTSWSPSSAPNGAVSIFNREGSAQVVADVVGYFRAPVGSVRFTAIAPARILDSRDGTGGYSTPWGPWTSRTLPVAGIAGVPADAKAVMINVTATNASAASYLTAWPSGQSLPLASNLNFGAGATVPNLVLVPIGADGRVAIFNLLGTVDVIVDVVGYTR